jgi:hydroxymethylglutaryl-CoA synthase
MADAAPRRGIVAWGAYLPHWRLDRSEIAAVAGGGGGRGTRTVASYDEDATTMAVEAARAALGAWAGAGGATDTVDAVWFATTSPPYLDRTNATAVHAALQLDPAAGAYDAVGSVRSASGALRAGLAGTGSALVVAADVRGGLPGGPDEAAGGDGAVALVVGDGTSGPLLAEHLASASATEELLDRWRPPQQAHSKLWEERFGETRYVPLGLQAWSAALERAGVTADEIDHVAIAGLHQRACTALAKRLGVGDRAVADHAASVGTIGAAHPGLLLCTALEQAAPGAVIALVTLSDGADVTVWRTTDALGGVEPARPVADQAGAGAPLPYGTYLRWRGLLEVEPPRRPEPARPSSSAAARSAAWKYGFVGSADDSGEVHLPPRPGDPRPRPMADATGTVVTFTVDRLAYSPSPPVVFAVVDFDGGGRLPVELTDVAPDEVRIGARVRMTFRRLFTADGIHNYFWKARLAEEGD